MYFVSCSDAMHAEALYAVMTAAGLRVWWDKRCLATGKEWRAGFCDGLAKSRAFVPIVSRQVWLVVVGGSLTEIFD
jgi:hypothetical protein